MALSFPNSPTLNQTYTLGARSWIWNGTSWNIVTTTSIVGYAGSYGYTGSTGDIGYTGSKGTDGIIGYNGSTGYTGSIGITGYVGSIGYTGSKGIDGIVGYNGSTGYTGSKGADGTFAGSTNQIVNITNTTSSTSTITGALVVAGGVGIGENLNVNGTIVGGGVRTTTSATTPVNPVVGDLWYNTVNDVTYRYTFDGTRNSWIDITGPTVTTTPGTVGTISPYGVSDMANTSTGYFSIPVGTTLQRPSVLAAGAMRVNSDTNYVEIYYNSAWFNLTYIGLVTATGGTITTAGNYKMHTFLITGSFNVTFAPTGATIECLIVGGGAGAGNGTNAAYEGGGGGAGGLVYTSSMSVSTSDLYTVTVGGGGTPSTSGVASSIGSALVALGGGAGANGGSGGVSGGSGGGGTHNGTAGAAGTQTTSGLLNSDSKTYGFGNAGGNGATSGGGGGGGAGAAGAVGALNSGGQGGIGKSYTISGAATYYAGGGGGAQGGASNGTLTTGGGGNGSAGTPGNSGTTNTGGGGGGAAGSGSSIGGSGGSGIVIIRYRYQ